MNSVSLLEGEYSKFGVIFRADEYLFFLGDGESLEDAEMMYLSLDHLEGNRESLYNIVKRRDKDYFTWEMFSDEIDITELYGIYFEGFFDNCCIKGNKK